MNYVGSIQIHGNTAIKARSKRDGTSAWLTLEIGQIPFSSITFHMPFDRADLLADAINKGEAEWAALLADEQEAEDKLIHRGQSFADEHRHRVHEVL